MIVIPPFLKRLFPQRPSLPAPRPFLKLERRPALIYAIGDIHGCLAELRTLQQMIIEDAADRPGDKLLVTVGDYVDRGPDSAGVIEFLSLPPPAGFSRICLAGNHEALMLAHIRSPGENLRWLDLGGDETLWSYGIKVEQYRVASQTQQRQLLQSHIPDEHLAFLEQLPAMLTIPDLVFAHAGLRDNVLLEDQAEEDLLWLRYPPDVGPTGFPLLIHGHTPDQNPVNLPSRLCIDTGCYATGRLTAVRLADENQLHFLTTNAMSRTL